MAENSEILREVRRNLREAERTCGQGALGEASRRLSERRHGGR
jgi:hypothetical protein